MSTLFTRYQDRTFGWPKSMSGACIGIEPACASCANVRATPDRTQLRCTPLASKSIGGYYIEGGVRDECSTCKPNPPEIDATS